MPDGVFDNVFNDQIVELLNSCEDVGTIAHTVALAAHMVGTRSVGRTPFAMKARAVGYTFDGGKLDDVTVLVAEVVKV